MTKWAISDYAVRGTFFDSWVVVIPYCYATAIGGKPAACTTGVSMGPAALLVGFFAGVGFAGFAADGHAEGDAGGGPFFADDVFEVAEVTVG